MSLSPNFHYGLPQSPRPNAMLSPINTSPSAPPSPRFDSGATSPASQMSTEKPQIFIDPRVRRRDSMIFVNATIPLSPRTSMTNDNRPDLASLSPTTRKRSGFAKWFSCFGSEARERRKRRFGEFERVEDVHWTEL